WMVFFIPYTIQAQSMDSLKTRRDSLKAIKKQVQQQLGKVNSSIDSVKKEIEILTGWRTDGSAVIGLNFTRTNNWVGNANPNAITSSLSIASAFSAQKNYRKGFWRNNVSTNLAWQSLDTDTGDGESTQFLADRTADIFTLSTLYGFNFDPSLAISALGDMNTALFNFLNTGSLNFSTGVTWKPPKASNLVVVGHVLSYQVAYSQTPEGDSDNDRALGAKLKISYSGKLPLKIKWSSNFNTFVPYTDPEAGDPGLFEYTWINTLATKFWKTFGVGVNVGTRKADFELRDTQWFSSVGISMSL
ncbi:MAG: DUF3078 domain-containing protein, partial [Bacteroidota bacterium]